MEQEIKEIIAKNLPQHVGDVLRTRLAHADKLELEINLLRDRYEDAQNIIKSLEKELEKEKDHRLSEISLKREWELIEERERNMEIEFLKLKLEESEKRTSFGNHLVEMVFKSPVYRKHVENMTLSSYDSQGRYNQTSAVPVHVTETTE